MGGASSILVHGFSWLEIDFQEIVNGLLNTQMYDFLGISIALVHHHGRHWVQAFPSPFSSMDS